MPEQTILDLGRMVKQKHAEYADLDDEEVGRRVKAKFPEYVDFKDTPSVKNLPSYANPKVVTPPGLMTDDQLESSGYQRAGSLDWYKKGEPLLPSDRFRDKDILGPLSNKRYATAGRRAIEEAAPAALLVPGAGPAMLAHPLRTLAGLALGAGGQQAGQATAEALGAEPDEAALYGYGAGALLGGIGSAARTARVASGVKAALPELLPARARAAYRIAADSFQDAPAPKTPVAFPDTATTNINSTRGPVPLPPPHDPTPQWEGMPQPIRTGGSVRAPVRFEPQPQLPPELSPTPPPRLPSGRIPGPTWLAGGPDEAAMSQLPAQVRPPSNMSSVADMPPPLPRPLSPRTMTEAPPEAFMNQETTGLPNEYAQANRTRLIQTAVDHIQKQKITAQDIEALKASDPGRYEIFRQNIGKIPGVSKQKNYLPSDVTMQGIIDELASRK